MVLKYINENMDYIYKESENDSLKKVCMELKEQRNFSTIVETLAPFLTSDANLLNKYLSKIILHIVSYKIPLKSNEDKNIPDWQHLENCVTLSQLICNPDVMQYTIKYLQLNPIAPFELENVLYNYAPKKRRLDEYQRHYTEYDVVACTYEFLKAMPSTITSHWNWSRFFQSYGNTQNERIKWILENCIATLTSMNERETRNLASIMKLDEDLSTKLELEEGSYMCSIPVNGCDEEKFVCNSRGIVDVGGIMLPVYLDGAIEKGNLVPVKSTQINLRSLALAVATGKAVVLLGPVGSGKTSLVEHLAMISGRSKILKKVQLGDQTDSRMLLGNYHCTDIPGEFVWRPGVLTEAVVDGHWLLLEDIDVAALDVASVLSSLLERNILTVPGYRDSLPVAPGFQLFLTQRTINTSYGFQNTLSNASALLQKHVVHVNVEPLSRSELAEIIETLYPQLKTICPRMIRVFMLFSLGNHDISLQNTESYLPSEKSTNLNPIKGNRFISTRDLLKWCDRIIKDYKVTSQESAIKVLQDAIDIFIGSVPNPVDRLEQAKRICILLGIVETQAEYYCNHYKPNISLKTECIEIGRAKLERNEKSLNSIDFTNKHEIFSFTRPTACLLEKIACCVNSKEPVLLVGETGTGKTTSIQYLAQKSGAKLVVINMNQQSDSADLLGGYKPVDIKFIITPIRYEYEDLFRQYFDVQQNAKFLNHVEHTFKCERWGDLLLLMQRTSTTAIARLTKLNSKDHQQYRRWYNLSIKLDKMYLQIKSAAKLTFTFIEGSLVKAMQEGHWVLLDEINLASAEILECLSGLLEANDETIDLLEKGDRVPIKKHSGFKLFACMNPATDVGKKELPAGLRNRFTEFFVDELIDKNDLVLLIGDYLYHLNLPKTLLEAVFNFYTDIRKEARFSLVDGSGNSPHYSLRTLCRALTVASRSNCGTVTRSLLEAFSLSFLTQLDTLSHPKVEAMIFRAVVGKKEQQSVLKQPIPEPKSLQKHLNFEGFWIPKGTKEPNVSEDYVLTPIVRKNLRDIARVISLGKLPILLQGDTSVGKTSLITYIAKSSGNYCVRINNHEHTDLQEYIGSYTTDAHGKLNFKEGLLVEAMRKGYWIILDELNLAPSDVLEALNRVLDDNRELYIPETQQVVKAHPNFILFATQNPPGLYGGRKLLSRAFRNRFVELHFNEIPRAELETILQQRCHLPATYCKKMIAVMAELQVRRRGSAAVQGKDGFITLRDLFRWGQRYKLASTSLQENNKFYDWDQHIADEGYLVLAGKVRQIDERCIIEEVLNKHFKRKVDPENLFTLNDKTSSTTRHILETLHNCNLINFSHVVWTYNMRRLAVLIVKSFEFDEPVLLVGETGCGKTTVCQMLAALRHTNLLTVNCHMHTESSDFIGGLRPVRQRKNDGNLFEWVDGPLIKAMVNGNIFLADEISLADDSVLERLNSLLEPERQLLLSERGTDQEGDIVIITAHEYFHFIGTMNPGGDFGKKELSPALRNRFTEIWCDHVTPRDDLLIVLEKSVSKEIHLDNQQVEGTSGVGARILDFTDWLKSSEITRSFPFSIRDLLTWVNFINTVVQKGIFSPSQAYVQGACMTFLDCFGTAFTGNVDIETLNELRKRALEFLYNQINDRISPDLFDSDSNAQTVCDVKGDKFGIHPFYIDVGPEFKVTSQQSELRFTFTAPTTSSNTLRLLRGMQLNKAIILEGNPGVGKTSLVMALAKAAGHKVVRINLSDQTDLADLFGTDLPTEDGHFAFKEGIFVSALKNGDWILLDELNLAPQQVLEGLNACLDHRGEVYVPELGKVFKINKQTKLFACQNPLKQGGARRGLPVSFLNRFTQVYVDTLTHKDLIFIVESQYPTIPKDILHRIVEFSSRVFKEICEQQLWGHRGSPWEINLRDVQRWCDSLIDDQKKQLALKPGKFVHTLFINRMRCNEDRNRMLDIYKSVFYPEYQCSSDRPILEICENTISIGDVSLERISNRFTRPKRKCDKSVALLRCQLPYIKSLIICVKMNWLSIVVGATSTGKSCIVQALADLTGNELYVLTVTSAMDVTDLLGGYEQVDLNRNLENIFEKIEVLTNTTVRSLWLQEQIKVKESVNILRSLEKYRTLEQSSSDGCNTFDNEAKYFLDKIQLLKEHCNMIKTSVSHNNDEVKTLCGDYVAHLDKLKSKVSMLKANGRFEWVDSLLVKCLTEGHWLLLDNVNLTSAAILDRLNSLLETNGVLSIPERGDVNLLKPHPNFRIFFTLDPKYGEISRAMRNRGVEICLLQSEEYYDLLKCLPALDVSALLSSVGLPTDYHAFCIELHNRMASFISSYSKPSISNLLKAVYMVIQQVKRGISLKAALINSYSDIYIKPRSGNDFASEVHCSIAEMKILMLKALEDSMSLYEVSEVYDHQSLHTIFVEKAVNKSNLAIVQQLSFSTLAQLNESLKCPTIESERLTFHALQICYLNSNEHNRKLMRDYIIYNVSKLPNYQQRLRWFLIGHEQIVSYCNQFSVTDYRFKGEREISFNTNESNKLSIMLHISSNILSDNECSKDLTPWLYSNSVLKGDMSDDFSDFPLLKYCSYYVEQLDILTQRIFQNMSTTVSDETYALFVKVMEWRQRFLKICKTPMLIHQPKKLPTLKDDVITYLHIHFYWLQKYVQAFLFDLLEEESQMGKQFISLIERCRLNVREVDSPLTKISKKIRKVFRQPAVHRIREDYERCVIRKELVNLININENESLNRRLFIIFSLQECIKQIDPYDIVCDVPYDDLTWKNIQKQYQSIEIDPNTEIEPYRKDFAMLPLKEYIAMKIIHLVKNTLYSILLEHNEIGLTGNVILKSISQFIDRVGSLPIVLKSFFKIICDGTNKDDRPISVCKFWEAFYRYELTCPAFYPDSYLKLSRPTNQLEIEERQELSLMNATRLSENIPLLAYIVTNSSNNSTLTDFPYKSFCDSVALKDTNDYLESMNSIQDLVWGNMLSMKTCSLVKSDVNAKFEMTKFENLLKYILKAVGSTCESGKPVSLLIVQCFEALTEFYQLNDIYYNNGEEILIAFLKKGEEIYANLEKHLHDKGNELNLMVETVKLSVLYSLLFVKIMSELSSIDPVEKQRLKVDYLNDDIVLFDSILRAYFVQGVVDGTILNTEGSVIVKPSDVDPKMYEDGNENKEILASVHPFCELLLKAKDETYKKVNKYSPGDTYRPDKLSYYAFVKETKHFTQSILSPSVVDEMFKQLCNISSELLKAIKTYEKNKKLNLEAYTVIQRTKVWLHSVGAFHRKIETEYSEAFPDLAMPLLASIAQVQASFQHFSDSVNELAEKNQFSLKNMDFPSLLEDLIRFPIIRSGGSAALVKQFSTIVLNDGLEYLLHRKGTSSHSHQVNTFIVLKMLLNEMTVVHSCLNEVSDFDNTSLVLNEIVSLWNDQQKQIEKKKEEEDNLYVTKSKCEDVDEEVLAQEEIMELFPTYSDDDFNDFQPETLKNAKPIQKENSHNKINDMINSEDAIFIYKWHSEFVQRFANAEWLVSPASQSEVDHVTPFLQRYDLFNTLVNGAWNVLDCGFDHRVSPSLLFYIAQIKAKLEGGETNNKVDFYLKPWVSEVQTILPLLTRVKTETQNLLKQWPDFPTLRDIMTVVDRMLSFSVRSPLARFLTGLELLRNKIEEWNSNAHKGNNMIEVSMAVGAQIISWRKLEMTHWRECLNDLFTRKKSEAIRYWFYVYNVIEAYLNQSSEGESISIDKITEVLRDFMEKSNLAEYEVRLNIIYSFHCHLTQLEDGEKRNDLISITWNTYKYYNQFLNQISNYIKEKRLPIEKKLKDYVKICSWDRDLSYWSVKDTVAKAHKVLHKHIKEFEDLLKKNVSVCIVLENDFQHNPDIGIWDRPKRVGSSTGGSYLIDVNNFVALTRNVKKFLETPEALISTPYDTELLQKVPSLFIKAKKICKQLILSLPYPSLVQSLDDFVTQVIETSTHLGSLNVESSDAKAKKTSQMKNILQQKRKGLADLFKSLHKMGLSYRAGLVSIAGNENLYDFKLKPVDLKAALTYLKSRKADSQLSLLWSGCEMYYQRNIARHKFLCASMLQPHPDLGIQNIEKCKGYAAILMKLTYTQKKVISDFSRHLFGLRHLLANMTYLIDFDESIDHKKTNDILNRHKVMLSNTRITLQQLLLVIKSCPDKPTNLEQNVSFDTALTTVPIVHCLKNSEEWTKIYHSIKELLSIVNKQSTNIDKIKVHLPNVMSVCGIDDIMVFSPANIDAIKESIESLRSVRQRLNEILRENSIKTEFCDDNLVHPILESIHVLSDNIEDHLKEVELLHSSNHNVRRQEDLVAFTNKSEDLVASLLLVIQKIYKKHVAHAEPDKSNDVNQDDVMEDVIVDKHLNKKLHESLLEDINDLKIKSIVSKMGDLLKQYVDIRQEDSDSGNVLNDVLTSVVPIVEQAVLFVQYFLTELVSAHRVSCKLLSVLMKIFSDLASKGFCKPDSMGNEEGEGDGGPGQFSSGTGLGDGEGQKDVSERIENQDQLDDAKRPDDEDTTENQKDCKEEEKGVTMTDDFDSHLQDIENKEGEDESNENEDEDDAEKQMGDTDSAAQNLDQQLWGSEEEESDTEETDKTKESKEEKGQGEKTGEKQMAAKEDDDQSAKDDGKEGKKDKNKDINEMDEPEVDDDHVDKYHGNQQELPEPVDFDMAPNLDAKDNEDNEEGKTENENPFDIDVMKEAQKDENKEDGNDSKDNIDDIEKSDKVKNDLEHSDDDIASDNEENEMDEGKQEDDMDVDQAEPGDELRNESECPDDTDEHKEESQQILDPIEDRKNIQNEVPEENQEKQEPNAEATPSYRDPTAEDLTQGSEMEKGTDDNVKTNQQQARDEMSAPYEQAQEQQTDESESKGRSELNKDQSGHKGSTEERSSKGQQSADTPTRKPQPKNKLGDTREDRTLGELEEPVQKKQKTMDLTTEEGHQDEVDPSPDDVTEADVYQHVQNSSNKDVQTIDAATKEQADKQPVVNNEEKPEDLTQSDLEDDIAMVLEEEDKDEKSKKGMKRENVNNGNQGEKEDGEEGLNETNEDGNGTGIETKGEITSTAHVQRPILNTHHTTIDSQLNQRETDLSMDEYSSLRSFLNYDQSLNTNDMAQTWRSLWTKMSPQARLLSERLRLVLEPTGRSRLAGDFRTGRRINMRRVIAYLASQFRKDRIWLRRTKPAKREYKIALALDDSSSMSDNRSKQLAFESLALISQALNLLESGDLAVLSFGEKPELLHPFSEQFSEFSGGKILDRLQFDQKKTKIAQLLDFGTVMFNEHAFNSDALNAKLLVIVSDGRAIFSEGEEKVCQSVRRARQAGIFLVYVIIDNPENKDSIMDIRRPIFNPKTNALEGLVSYLDTFPFPFYVVVRDISSLPTVLGDALRQWFELATTV